MDGRATTSVATSESGTQRALVAVLGPYVPRDPVAPGRVSQPGLDGALRSAFVDCLRAGLTDRPFLAAAAQRSYRHANGFVKLVLVATDAYKLRLHLWRQHGVAHRAIEDIHNHRWDFTTMLVHGSYRHETFERAEQGHLMRHYEYSSPGVGETYRMQRTGAAHLIRRSDEIVSSGESYTIHHGVLHRVSPVGDDPVASVFLQGPLRRMNTDVYTDGAVDTEVVPVARLTMAELIGELEHFLAHA